MVRRIVLAGLILGLLFLAGSASALSEVWIGSGPPHGPVQRFDLSGNLLGSFNTGGDVDGMAFTGSEVWIGSDPPNGTVQRFDLSGTLLGSFDTGGGVDGMTFVPEPNTALLLGVGLAGLGMRRRVH